MFSRTGYSAISRSAAQAIVAVAAMSVAVACGDSPSGPGSDDAPAKWILEPVGERAIEAVAGSTIDGPQVAVKEGGTGKPLAGVEILFVLAMDGWSGQIARFVTDDRGIASPGNWMIPLRAGGYTLGAIAGGSRTDIRLQVKAAAPAQLQKADTDIAGIAGEDVPGPVMTVRDAYGNAAAGLTVTFEVTGGDGSIANSEVVTDRDGLAFPGRWKLGPRTGDNVLVARVAGVEPVTILTRGLERSSLDWYVLETAAAKIESSMLGVTRFDPCLCRDEDGYFVVEIKARSWPLALVSGAFRVEPPGFRIKGAVEYPWRAYAYTPLYWIGGQQHSIQSNRFPIEIYRWDPDWWEWWSETWIFRQQP